METHIASQELESIRISVATLQTILGDQKNIYTTTLATIMDQYNQIIISEKQIDISRYKKSVVDKISRILQENKATHLQYLLSALREDKSRFDEIVQTIEKYKLESFIKIKDIDFLLGCLDSDNSSNEMSSFLSILRKINKEELFNCRYNRVSKKDTDNRQINQLYDIIDKDLLKQKLRILQGSKESTEMENILIHIASMPAGEEEIKRMIDEGTIDLYNHLWANYNFIAIKLLSKEERLAWFKKKIGQQNLNTLLFNETSLLNLIDTENEILGAEGIRELFNLITYGGDIKKALIASKLPETTLSKLGVKREQI